MDSFHEWLPYLRRPVTRTVIPATQSSHPAHQMIETVLSTQGWSVLDHPQGVDLRRLTRNLADSGINHITKLDGDAIVVAVPSAQVDEATTIALCLSSPVTPDAPEHVPYYGTYLRLLISIPSGAIIGNSLFADWATEPRFVASACAVAAAVFVEVVVNAWCSLPIDSVVGTAAPRTIKRRG